VLEEVVNDEIPIIDRFYDDNDMQRRGSRFHASGDSPNGLE